MQFLLDLWNTVYGFLLSRFQTILVFALVLILGAVVIRSALAFFRRHIDRSRIKGATGDFLLSVIRVALYLVYFIALLALLGVPTTSMIALLSAFALAVSLALQGTLSNVASGIVIVMTKPFAEGDYVEIGEVAGTVETVTVFHTRLLTPDNKEIVLPNATVSGASITNYSAKEARRLELSLAVSYRVSVDRVREVALGVLAAHGELLGDPAPTVRLLEQERDALRYTVRVWVKQKDYWELRFTLMEELVRAFAENGFGAPAGRMEVQLEKEPLPPAPGEEP